MNARNQAGQIPHDVCTVPIIRQHFLRYIFPSTPAKEASPAPATAPLAPPGHPPGAAASSVYTPVSLTGQRTHDGALRADGFLSTASNSALAAMYGNLAALPAVPPPPTGPPPTGPPPAGPPTSASRAPHGGPSAFARGRYVAYDPVTNTAGHAIVGGAPVPNTGPTSAPPLVSAAPAVMVSDAASAVRSVPAHPAPFVPQPAFVPVSVAGAVHAVPAIASSSEHASAGLAATQNATPVVHAAPTLTSAPIQEPHDEDVVVAGDDTTFVSEVSG